VDEPAILNLKEGIGTHVELHPIANWILVFFFVFSSFISSIALLALLFALRKLITKIEELTPKVNPIIDKVDQALTTANNKLTSLGDKAEHIIMQGEEVADNIHQKVDRTATVVQRTVHAPIITLNSLAAGFSRGVITFGQLQRREESSTNRDAPIRPGLEIAAPHNKDNKEATNTGQGILKTLHVPAG